MHDIDLVVNLAACLVAALACGLITERLRLSPIVGYLFAGILLGPYTPGFVADPEMAMQFAEIGVVLLMFGVGLHFNLRDLWRVRKIAISGAVGQSVVATLLGTLTASALGYSVAQGVILGIAISVASTVVLIRALTDNDLLQTSQGHIAVGWLIVEDIFTVLVLVALPAAAGIIVQGGEGEQSVFWVLLMATLRIALLAAIVLGVGNRIIPWLLRHVVQTRSRELFTLAVLSLALTIAVGSTYLGVSMALGAFLAGIVIGQTEVSHQAAADALPMRDAFAVLFFVSVGMLFDYRVIVDQPLLLAALVAITLVAKPLTALGIVWLMRYSFASAITVAIALAQVGEFSFLLADEAIGLKLLPATARSLLVACAILSITLNPLLFRLIGPAEQWLRARPALWRRLTARSEAGGDDLNRQLHQRIAAASAVDANAAKRAVIVGYGPVGQTAARLLRDFGVETIVVDLNLDTVRDVASAGQLAVYGDSTRQDILEAAGVRDAEYLLITVPDVLVRTLVTITAKELNPGLKIFVRARYINERAWLEELGVTQVCTEEAETALGLATLLLQEVGADQKRVRKEIGRVQEELGLPRRKDVRAGDADV
jgi:CPA2 family monovalent cation:H+ antiporter-2